MSKLHIVVVSGYSFEEDEFCHAIYLAIGRDKKYSDVSAIHLSPMEPIHTFVCEVLKWDGRKTEEFKNMIATVKHWWDSQDYDSTAFLFDKLKNIS